MWGPGKGTEVSRKKLPGHIRGNLKIQINNNRAYRVTQETRNPDGQQ